MSKEDNKNLKNGGEKMLEAMNNIDDKYLAEYDTSVKEGFVIGEKEGFVKLWFNIDNNEYEIKRSID